MPRFEPFAALRYAPGADLDAVIAPPYDVLSETEIANLCSRDEHNVAIIDNPRGGEDRYRRAAERMRGWVDDGVLVTDEVPTFTLYRMRFRDETGAARDLVGVLGGLEVVDEGGDVLPHERTTKKASTDRLDLTRASEANLSPVWGLSLATGLTELLAEPGEPMGSLVVGGVEHIVERVSDADRISAIKACIGSDDVLIADGHHRYGVARRYRDEIRTATRRHDTAAECTLAFVGEMVADQLSIEAIHRLYHRLPFERLRESLTGCFELAPAPEPTPELLQAMAGQGRLVLVGPESTEWLIPKPGAFDGVRALDGAWLEHALGTDVEVTYQHGVREATEAVRGGQASGGVLIRPTSLTEIERTAREGLLMPPKSTFFTPKLRTGLVIRDLA